MVGPRGTGVERERDMDGFFQDIRFALASIRRRPLLAVAVILTLGLGIGASAAIFRSFSAAFLRPLPFANEERLVRLYLSDPARDANLSPRADVFVAIRDRARSFAGVAGQRFNDFTAVIDGGEPVRMAGIEVSEGWSGILGLDPILGRTFTSEEEAKGIGSGVALISHGLWKSRYGSSAEVLGRSMTLNGRSVTIVGVLPPGLRFPYESEVWVPARFDVAVEATWGLNIIARLRDGTSLAAVAAELEALTREIPEVRAQQGMAVTAVPIREVLIDDDGGVLVAVSIAAIFLLVLITVNIANLLAAHSLSRRREFAIRTAMGASLRRHLQQTLTEGLLLALAGGIVGLGVAWVSSGIINFLVPGDFSYVLEEVPFDGRVVAFTFFVAAATGMVFGAIPALRVARANPNPILAGGGERVGDRPAEIRVTGILTVIQIAFAVVLLAGALSMIRDFERRATRDLGYETSGLLTFSVVLPESEYQSASERDAFFDSATEKLAALPVVAAVGTVNLFPAAGQGSIMSRIEGGGVPYDESSPLLAHSRMVHGELMDALSPRLLRGRLISAEDARRAEPVAVISRSLASALWSRADPIGKKVRASRAEDAPWLEVVGVIDDLEEFYGEHSRSIWQPVKLYTDQPLANQMVFVVRAAGAADLEAAMPALRESVHSIDASLAIFEVFTADDLYAQSLTGRRSARTLTTGFALLALLVAAIGIYAAMAFAMSRRGREVAVRLALGGTGAALTRHFMGEAVRTVGVGIGIGLAATFATARVLGNLVDQDDPVSVMVVLAAAFLLAAVAITASWLPLRRAIRIEPSAVLRGD
jgi:putative ABC transport system permease protein